MEYTFSWFIENYSYCFHKYGQGLKSPAFFPKGQESSAWCLSVYPRGRNIQNKSYVSLFLERSLNDDGPESVSLKFELSILRADGSAFIKEGIQSTFGKGISLCTDMLEVHELYRQKAAFLPQDVLSVRCKMWINEEDVHKVGQGFARTRIGVEHISFIHVFEGFSKLAANQKKTFEIRKNEAYMTSSIYFDDSSCSDGRIILEVTPSSIKRILLKYNLFLMGASGIVSKCGEGDNRFDDPRKDITILPLSFTRKEILGRKSEFLPADKLTLIYECTFSTGVEFEKIEKTLYEIPSSVVNEINNYQNDGRSKVAEKLSSCPGAIDDFKSFYSTQLLTDVEMKTETKSYPAHRSLLCSRSPVLKAIFTDDMKEKNTGCIQVVDLENDTVEALLHFLYSDNLENIEWDSAIKLYFEADKYAIEKLKLMCSSILIDSLSTSNAIELLLLADAHRDSCLNEAVVDFILKHKKEVCSSKEWVKLKKTHSVLAYMTLKQMNGRI